MKNKLAFAAFLSFLFSICSVNKEGKSTNQNPYKQKQKSKDEQDHHGFFVDVYTWVTVVVPSPCRIHFMGAFEGNDEECYCWKEKKSCSDEKAANAQIKLLTASHFSWQTSIIVSLNVVLIQIACSVSVLKQNILKVVFLRFWNIEV